MCRTLATILFFLLAWNAPAAEGVVSFRNEIMALISRAGCNAGACHGNANGKGGFKLSLRGESPDLDFAVITRENFGRRIDLSEARGSLLLLKATAQIAHEGGRRFTTNSLEYQTFAQWINEGAK